MDKLFGWTFDDISSDENGDERIDIMPDGIGATCLFLPGGISDSAMVSSGLSNGSMESVKNGLHDIVYADGDTDRVLCQSGSYAVVY